jgi:hypothetical protein
MYTPEEAIEEMEFASKQLGYKGIVVGGLMRRPIPTRLEEKPDAARLVEWYDVIGIDSDHDYDPVWAHNGARSILPAQLAVELLHDHIGHFASAGRAVCKALFFGGVTRRFPDLNFAFLEGGLELSDPLLGLPQGAGWHHVLVRSHPMGDECSRRSSSVGWSSKS